MTVLVPHDRVAAIERVLWREASQGSTQLGQLGLMALYDEGRDVSTSRHYLQQLLRLSAELTTIISLLTPTKPDLAPPQT